MLGLPLLSRRAELPVMRAGCVRQVRQDPYVSAPLFSAATGLAVGQRVGEAIRIARLGERGRPQGRRGDIAEAAMSLRFLREVWA